MYCKRRVIASVLTFLSVFYVTIFPSIAADSVHQEDMEVFVLYDVPLEEELQRHIYEECLQTGIRMEIVLALIETESSYRKDIVSKTNDYGLMQINRCNHGWLKKELGITDILDPKSNITAGVYILKQHFDVYGDTHKALMAYNMGAGTASKLWKKGIYESKYSRKIVNLADEIRGRQ